jgi:hypothetical protein
MHLLIYLVIRIFLKEYFKMLNLVTEHFKTQ